MDLGSIAVYEFSQTANPDNNGKKFHRSEIGNTLQCNPDSTAMESKTDYLAFITKSGKLVWNNIRRAMDGLNILDQILRR